MMKCQEEIIGRMNSKICGDVSVVMEMQENKTSLLNSPLFLYMDMELVFPTPQWKENINYFEL
jgi:hypothetical protein